MELHIFSKIEFPGQLVYLLPAFSKTRGWLHIFINSKSVSKMLPSIIRFTVTLFPRGSRVAGSLSKATTRVSLDETFSVSDVCTGPFSTPADADSDEVSEGAGEDPSVVCFSSPPLPPGRQNHTQSQ